jgi:hypothetical protein|tara:strand:+ start:883 stop:1077 length:195 start_codon:yes stop_codon:yes gene_type:complete
MPMQDDEVVSQQILALNNKAMEELNNLLKEMNDASANKDEARFREAYDILKAYIMFKMDDKEAN